MNPTVPLMDPRRAYLAYREEFDGALRSVLERGTYILGPNVAEFESAFAAWSALRSLVAVANGTDAIELALRTLGVGPGDAVFTVSHTAVATVAAIELCGARPVLVDIDPATYTIDPQKLQDSIARSAEAGRPKAVVAVHLYGQPCDLASVREICERHGLLLIEDCAQAHGARFDGEPVGARADAASFSFYPTKNLPAFGDGGAVGFKNADHAQHCRALREYGWRERYVSDIAGMNSRLDELQAALLNVRLRHLDAEIDSRRRAARYYSEHLRGLVQTPAVAPRSEHAWHLYVVRSTRRQELREALQRQGIGTGIHYPVPVHLQPAYHKRVLVGAGGQSATEAAAAQILSLPMHPFLTTDELALVVTGVRNWHEAAA